MPRDARIPADRARVATTPDAELTAVPQKKHRAHREHRDQQGAEKKKKKKGRERERERSQMRVGLSPPPDRLRGADGARAIADRRDRP
jgi:hypothetical protein